MSTLNVVICNERFIARYGVDRMLLMLGRHLMRTVNLSLYFTRADQDLIQTVSATYRQISLSPELGIRESEFVVQEQCRMSWAVQRPDVVICGGWPFLSISHVANEMGIKSIFLDAGAVPHDGMGEGAYNSQRELRRIRQFTLPAFDAILPISDFVKFSQTIPDRGSEDGVETVLLGSDHLVKPSAGRLSIDNANFAPLPSETDIRVDDSKLNIMLLGRFEAENYKNSQAAFDIIQFISKDFPSVNMFILSGGQTIEVPANLERNVTLLDIISDTELLVVMGKCVVGFSMSLWEGFNLPLVEMQSLALPVLAFAVGAHAEVIAHPWFLCASVSEMAFKAQAIMANPSSYRQKAIYEEKQRELRWASTLNAWTKFIVDDSPLKPVKAQRRLVMVDVTNACQDIANSGVMRVARRLSLSLQDTENWDTLFVKWSPDLRVYSVLDHKNVRILATNAGPISPSFENVNDRSDTESLMRMIEATRIQGFASTVMIIPEVVLDGSMAARIDWCRYRDIKSVTIFHDLIPILHPELVSKSVGAQFPVYIDALIRSDLIISDSSHSLEKLKDRFVTELSKSRPHVDTVWLPAQFSDLERRFVKSNSNPDIMLLCVCTIEPRKNHLSLLKAFRKLRQRRPDLSLFLNLVGNAYAGAEQLLSEVQAYTREDRNISYLGILSDQDLADQYASCTITIYPSLMEGFGIPIVESLWMGKPCICHGDGVMLELAKHGGCVTVDMRDPDLISSCVEMLLDDPQRIEGLLTEIQRRSLASWGDYAIRIKSLIEETFNAGE